MIFSGVLGAEPLGGGGDGRRGENTGLRLLHPYSGFAMTLPVSV